MIRVVAGVLRDGQGRILLSQRPEGKHLAGSWEFPGGKCEPDESPGDALARELEEELGIGFGTAEPLLTLTHAYPGKTIRLMFYEVGEVSGQVRGREGQPLKWAGPDEIESLDMPAADRPVIKLIDADPRYAITPDPVDLGGVDAVLAWSRNCLESGVELLQLRAHSLDPAARADLAGRFGALVHSHGARWLLNGPVDLAFQTGADGVHLPSRELKSLESRPLPENRLVAASCHDAAELGQAGRIGADFVTLSPVSATPSHPQARTLGWKGFATLCAQSPLPVFALGGVGPSDLARIRLHGGFGVAGIRAFSGP